MKFFLRIYCESKEEFQDIMREFNWNAKKPNGHDIISGPAKTIHVDGPGENITEDTTSAEKSHPDSVKCASPECSKLFIPTRKNQRFCSSKCYNREYMKSWKKGEKNKDFRKKLEKIKNEEPVPGRRPQFGREIG